MTWERVTKGNRAAVALADKHYSRRKPGRSTNPGFCFKCAGWRTVGRSADNRKTLLSKPFARAGIA